MKKLLITLAAAIATCVLVAAPRGPRASQNHVPSTLEGTRQFETAAANYNHIALVNVGGAVADEDWALSATYAVSLLQINVWTNSAASIELEKLVKENDYTAKLLGNEKAKVAVYFVNIPGGARIISSPGAWAVVNTADLKEGNPDAQIYRDRVAKSVMKGLAAAGGGGATLEPFCSLFYGSQDIQGMDKTNIAISPMCYFPMLEILRGAGGNEIIAPVGEMGEEE